MLFLILLNHHFMINFIRNFYTIVHFAIFKFQNLLFKLYGRFKSGAKQTLPLRQQNHYLSSLGHPFASIIKKTSWTAKSNNSHTWNTSKKTFSDLQKCSSKSASSQLSRNIKNNSLTTGLKVSLICSVDVGS